MSTSTSEVQVARALNVTVTEDSLTVDLVDGRTVVVPLAWYPRLLQGPREERNSWRLIGRGVGIRWPNLDEDIRVEGLLAGKASGESQESFKRWLGARATARSSNRIQATARKTRRA